jgi:hypothetical protein
VAADGGHACGFAGSFGSERVINSRRLYVAGPSGGGQQQQGEAVGAARHRDADASARGNQRVEVAAEPVEDLHT